MKILYISPYSVGSTSRMRAEYLKEILNPSVFTVIDTEIPASQCNSLYKSIAWRFKIGPFISRLNSFIYSSIPQNSLYDIIWIDKGVFILPKLVKELKKKTAKLIHYTPDPAFIYHKSHLFNMAVPFYDYCVTTKSFEIEMYNEKGAKDVILSTQGFDPMTHRPHYKFEEKKGISFLGHREDDREYIITKLIEANIQITIAGIKWESFARKRKRNPNLIYLGKGIYGEEYAKTISKSLFSLGLLSKIIPELHTTRTFEIPACKTALLTEKTSEIISFFSENEALYFSDTTELIELISYYGNHLEELKQVIQNGYTKIFEKGYTYKDILRKLCNEMKIETN